MGEMPERQCEGLRLLCGGAYVDKAVQLLLNDMLKGQHCKCHCKRSFVGGSVEDLEIELKLLDVVPVEEAPHTDGRVLVRTLSEATVDGQRDTRFVRPEARCRVTYELRRAPRYRAFLEPSHVSTDRSIVRRAVTGTPSRRRAARSRSSSRRGSGRCCRASTRACAAWWLAART